MKKRNLGNELTVSAIGLGCMGFTHAYGYPVEKEEAIDTIRYVYSIGYDFFDTAECYVGTFQDGRKSINEEIVGEALVPYKDAKIATKCGIKINEDGSLTPDGRPENIIASAEKSLKRLKRDHIDLYYLHRMDPEVPPEEVAFAFQKLKNEGKIISYGLSECTSEYLERANRVEHVAAIQNRYSMMARSCPSLQGRDMREERIF